MPVERFDQSWVVAVSLCSLVARRHCRQRHDRRERRVLTPPPTTKVQLDGPKLTRSQNSHLIYNLSVVTGPGRLNSVQAVSLGILEDQRHCIRIGFSLLYSTTRGVQIGSSNVFVAHKLSSTLQDSSNTAPRPLSPQSRSCADLRDQTAIRF